MGARGRMKAWRKGYEVMLTRFVAVFVVESRGFPCDRGIINVDVCEGFWFAQFYTVFGQSGVFHYFGLLHCIIFTFIHLPSFKFNLSSTFEFYAC
jgi:hypothetical protein